VVGTGERSREHERDARRVEGFDDEAKEAFQAHVVDGAGAGGERRSSRGEERCSAAPLSTEAFKLLHGRAELEGLSQAFLGGKPGERLPTNPSSIGVCVAEHARNLARPLRTKRID